MKRRYRDILRTTDARVRFLHLDGSPDLIGARIERPNRPLHAVGMLDSQLATLEPLEADEDGVSVSIDGSPTDILARALTALGLRPAPAPARGRDVSPP